MSSFMDLKNSLLTKWQEMNSLSDMFIVYYREHGPLFVTHIGHYHQQTQGGGNRSGIYKIRVAAFYVNTCFA